MVWQRYHDNTGHNDVFVDGGKIPEISGEELQKLAKKAVNKNSVKT